MSFLYPAFLAGALAIALPIVLHLLRRDVAPEVPFTAVHLLRKSPVERSKRRRLRDLLLLAARVTALLLLAAAFARPYRANAAAGVPLVIVAVDRSYSMTAPGRFAHVLDLARKAIDGAGGSRVALLAFDERADQLAAPGSAAEARAALKTVEPGFAGTRYAPAIARAAEIAAAGPARLVIVTDLQRAGWEDEQPVTIPSALTLEVEDAGAPPPNAAIVRARIERAAIVASIRNGTTTTYAGPVRVALDGRDVASAPASIAPGATADVVVPYQPPATGTLTVSIDDPQGFTADNSRYLLLDRAPRRRVLIVGSATPPNQSGFYLTRALATASANDDGLETEVVAGSALLGMKAESSRRTQRSCCSRRAGSTGGSATRLPRTSRTVAACSSPRDQKSIRPCSLAFSTGARPRGRSIGRTSRSRCQRRICGTLSFGRSAVFRPTWVRRDSTGCGASIRTAGMSRRDSPMAHPHSSNVPTVRSPGAVRVGRRSTLERFSAAPCVRAVRD